MNNEIKYVEYYKDNNKKEEIRICTKDFIFYCGIKNSDYFYVFGYSQRVLDSFKKNGHIIEDKFVLTDVIRKFKYNSTNELIDKLIILNKNKLNEKEENKKKKIF